MEMTAAFGSEVFRCLSDSTYNTKASNMARSRQNVRRTTATTSGTIKEESLGDLENWPRVVSDDVKMKCMRDYITNSTWRTPDICVVCSRDQCGVPITIFELGVNDEECSVSSVSCA
jgi:hypothetical protein